MNLVFVKKLDFQVRKIKVDSQTVDVLKLDTFDIVITSFSMKDKERMSYFFEKTFLLADISMDITLDMPFSSLSNIEIDFVDCHID